MNAENFCVQCGNKLEPDALFCPKCGTKISASTIEAQTAQNSTQSIQIDSPKSSKVVLILCLLFGMLGAHRFYVGKIWTGILMLFTAGLVGVWVVIDLILIVRNKFEDKNGKPLELTQDLTPLKETIFVFASVMVWFALFFAAIAALLRYTTSDLVTVVDSELAALQTGQIEKAYSYTSKDFQNIISISGFKKYVSEYPALINNASSSFSERKIINNNGYLAGTLTAKDGTQTPVVFQLIKENGQWRILNIKIMNPPTSKPNNSPK